MSEKTQELDVPQYSTMKLTEMIREAFARQFNRRQDGDTPTPYSWVRDIYVGHPQFGDSVVATREDMTYMVNMDLSGERPTFGEEWRAVRPTYEIVQPEQEGMMGAESDDLDLGTFAEAAQAIAIQEKSGADRRDPLTIRFVMIKPGFGNPKDNHYYPREVLERDAHRFVGAKMYATDHRADQRSVLTEVAVISQISGFTDEGAPIAEATVWGPDFAEQVRNRNRTGTLNLLECSIIGRGKAKRGKVDGRDAKIVQEIEEGRAVDWVSRAGAGGHALDISESDDLDTGGMEVDEKQEEIIEESADPAAKVDIQESEGTPTGEQPQEKETEVITQEAALSQDTVDTLLRESRLGDRAQRLLAGATYRTDEEVQTAIQEMTGLIKQATGAGKPFEQGQTPTNVTETDAQFWEKLGDKYGMDFYTEEAKE